MKKTLLIAILVLAIFFGACSPSQLENDPAAQDCEANGGKVEIRNENGEQMGYCVFPDDSECSEQEYKRSMCEYQQEEEPSSGLANPASTYCVEQGGTLEMRSDDEGNVSGFCIFPDGSECEEWAFFNNECGQEENLLMDAPPEDAILGNAFVNNSNINIMESFPIQVSITIQGDLPDPCHQLFIEIEGPDSNNNIFITTRSWYINNGLSCIQVLDPFEETVSIPTANLEDGTYTIFINEVEIGTFNYPG